METVRKLLAGGANPNTKDHAGWTPLVSYIPDYNMANLTCFIVLPILGDLAIFTEQKHSVQIVIFILISIIP